MNGHHLNVGAEKFSVGVFKMREKRAVRLGWPGGPVLFYRGPQERRCGGGNFIHKRLKVGVIGASGVIFHEDAILSRMKDS